METSFLSGSENLYKYLVTMGLVLMVSSVLYPLREKQDLQIKNGNLLNDLKILNYQIKEINTELKTIDQTGTAKKPDSNSNNLKDLVRLHQESVIKQFELEKKADEMKIRTNHIRLFDVLFYFFFPFGFILAVFGYLKWMKVKKCDDSILHLQRDKLELEVEKLRLAATNPPPPAASSNTPSAVTTTP